jgi:hypothetical protein
MPSHLVPLVVVQGVLAIEQPHALAQLGGSRPQNQVVVVGHQAISEEHAPRSDARFAEEAEELQVIEVLVEER